jgi:NTE family protein
MFPPVTIDGDVLVDGGVVNNVPISRALTAGCDRIYVLLCGPLHYHPRPPSRPVEAALTAFFVAVHARFVRELATLPPGIEVVVFSGGGDPSGQYRDFSNTPGLIAEGRAEVADVLDRYVGTSHDLHLPSVTPPHPFAETGAAVHAGSDAGSDGTTTPEGAAPTEPLASP